MLRHFFTETRKELRFLYDKLVFPVARADLFRYAVLHTYGGLYMDSDIECRLPLDELFNVTRFLDESAKLRKKEKEEGTTITIITNKNDGSSIDYYMQILSSGIMYAPGQGIPLFVCFTNVTNPTCSHNSEDLVSVVGPNTAG